MKKNTIIIYSKEVAHWLNRREPLKRKFTRWIFGVKNIVPTTIEEQNVDDVRKQTQLTFFHSMLSDQNSKGN